jgi:hypothetical protein
MSPTISQNERLVVAVGQSQTAFPFPASQLPQIMKIQTGSLSTFVPQVHSESDVPRALKKRPGKNCGSIQTFLSAKRIIRQTKL